jgi:hypothetical protein
VADGDAQILELAGRELHPRTTKTSRLQGFRVSGRQDLHVRPAPNTELRSAANRDERRKAELHHASV